MNVIIKRICKIKLSGKYFFNKHNKTKLINAGKKFIRDFL